MQSWNEYMKEYWRKNPEKYEIHKRQMRKNTKIWNSRHKERKRECSKIWRLNHLEQCRLLHEYSKRKTLEMRLEIFRLLGNKCSNPHCLIPNGCQDRRCLQIDHVHGHGTREVKKFKGRIPYYKFILNQIKEGSRDYQLLCANCNWIKRVERNEVAFGSTKGI